MQSSFPGCGHYIKNVGIELGKFEGDRGDGSYKNS